MSSLLEKCWIYREEISILPKKGKAIYLNGQKKVFKVVVHDTSTKIREKQKSETGNGYFIYIKTQNVLPFFTVRIYKNLEWKTLPYIPITIDID